MKESMLESVKRKRAMIKQHEEDEQPNSHSSDDSDELAPEGSSSKDALYGKPVTEGYAKDAESKYEQENVTQQGQRGFDHEAEGASAPHNNKVLFHDPKSDTHDPVDLNAHNNMAGEDRGDIQHSNMGVDAHKEPREQSSALAAHNAKRAEALKASSRADVKSKMALPDHSVMPEEGGEKVAPGKSIGFKSAREKLFSKFKMS